jgi:hypothetical protein
VSGLGVPGAIERKETRRSQGTISSRFYMGKEHQGTFIFPLSSVYVLSMCVLLCPSEYLCQGWKKAWTVCEAGWIGFIGGGIC